MADKLHYNMAEVEADYRATYSMFMKAAAVGIVGAVIYFFVLAVYLGFAGHTHSTPFVQTFAADQRIEIDYTGKKLPMFENPALVLPAEPAAEVAAQPASESTVEPAAATAEASVTPIQPQPTAE